ncbi:hypothetical protein [Jannaschia ovalis]|uniref:Uncharacterized protein n=1 Tax=Jannaschia ovalis TaxID=3038773 RepID=A0ABY8LFG9_9RHOB|nr:hypothetical protein [Jannaschia sp. GRR-S6-38]WGH80032.1 hypothetical protein P8627_07160 [Jannaschia sp. GRR-S6-38]
MAEESYGISDRLHGHTHDGEEIHMISATDMDDALVVLPPRDDAPQMWLDDRFHDALFVSDRVAKALKAAKLTRGWGLRRCVVKTVH